MSVVGAVEFQHQIAFRKAASGADGGHGGFGAGGNEADALDGWKNALNLVRQVHLERRRHPVARAALRLIGNRRHNFRMRVAQN